MANYNYVAPVKITSFSDIAKEQQLLANERKKQGLAQQNNLNKQHQKYIDRIEKVSTENWADILRSEFLYWKNTAINQIQTDPNVNLIAISDALMEFQSKGDNHAKVYDGDGQYQQYVDEPALYDTKLPYGQEAVFSYDELALKRTRYNNVNLYNYGEKAPRIGDFGNPDYDSSDSSSAKTLRELAVKQGKTIQTEMSGPHAGKDYYIGDNDQRVYVSGSGFDSPDLGNLGVYNPTLQAQEDILPSEAHQTFETRNGGKHFKTLSTNLNRQVDSGEKTYEQAREAYINDALEYIDPLGMSPNKGLKNSAIEAWERASDTDFINIESISQATIDLYGTPWEFYANAMADVADLYDPEKGTNPNLTATEKRQRRQLKSKAITEPAREFVREIKDPQYDWDQALINAETEGERKIIKDFVELDSSTGKYELKAEFGDGARVMAGPKDVEYKGYKTNQVEVFDDMNKVIIYMAGRVGPGDSDIPEEAGDDIRWMPMFSDTATSPFMVINMFKPDSFEYTEEYEELINSFDAIFTNALQSKIDAVQQDDE